jgi:hypothetical protein
MPCDYLALIGPGDPIDSDGNRHLLGAERYLFGLILLFWGALLLWDPRKGLPPFIDSFEWSTSLFNRFQFLKSPWWVALFRVIGLFLVILGVQILFRLNIIPMP